MSVSVIRSAVCCPAGHVTRHVDSGGAATRSFREPEPVWRQAVAKPPMSDALRDATRTEVPGNNEFQHRAPQPANYQLYQVLVPIKST